MKNKRNPKTIHPPFSTYSHQIELVRETRLLVMSGQVGADSTGKIVDGVSEQLKLAWHNVAQNLREANMTLENIIKTTIYLEHGCINTVDRRRLFAEMFDTLSPCMTVLYVPGFGDNAMKVELDVWASAE